MVGSASPCDFGKRVAAWQEISRFLPRRYCKTGISQVTRRLKQNGSTSSGRGSQPVAGSATPTLVERLQGMKHGVRPAELANLLGVGKSTLYDWVEAGTIPAYRHRGVIFFDPALIAAWLRERET
jgi:excisionase family DNA binding protein